ncbi:PREDICTED: uncharacterized protein LOC108558035 [Nicrophorus vespilloides]|uniref:Uncharacterized protein LOC108558035 n=1 Tax=Nicrophorus vespilloides TaxID=110193 RepID=A0ABM1M6W1_NICVS|nr:PREDICTED: uncharacterized protein LOC108558035 [Nicrophorus vespilloides]
MFVRLLCCALYTLSLVVHGKIEIRDANVATLSRDDIGMIFYITVQNSDICGYEVKVSMIECTEVIDEKDKDSGFMYLIGGHMGYLKPKCYKNVTLLYPNMYLHNRRGYCLISLKFKSDHDQIQQKKANITFDTWISKSVATPPILRGYYSKTEVRNCASPDLDPLNKCKPVDCHRKYLGSRNYFNKKWQRCQKVPVCVADPSKELVDVIFTPSNNKCRDMEKSVTKSDLQLIEAGTLKGPCEETYQSLLNIDCHYGKLNNVTGDCECDPGWMSAPFDKDQTDVANLFVYHMCNIEVAEWYDTSSRKIKVMALIVGVRALFVDELLRLGLMQLSVCRF